MAKETFYIPKAKEIMDKAVKKVKNELDNVQNTSKKPKHIFIADKEKKRICLINDEIKIQLENTLKQFPSIEKLQDVHKDLFLNEIDLKTIKQSLSHIAKTKFLLNDLKNNYLRKINSNLKAAPKFRSEFLGRILSIIKKLDSSLDYIRVSAKTLKRAPEFKNYPTAVIVGLPNCGKSTFLNKITGSKVEIKDYAFTTQRLQVGIFEERYKKYQLIDSPGLLVRDISKMNLIERQTIIAVEKLAKAVIFLIALDEDAEKQKKLIKKIPNIENKDYIIIFTKMDLMLPREIEEFIPQFKDLKPKAFFVSNLNKMSQEEIDKIKVEISKLLS
jgi:nucleolar GTP-binding protein